MRSTERTLAALKERVFLNLYLESSQTTIPLDESLSARLGINIWTIKIELERYLENSEDHEQIVEYWATALTLSWLRNLERSGHDMVDVVRRNLEQLLNKGLLETARDALMTAADDFIGRQLGEDDN